MKLKRPFLIRVIDGALLLLAIFGVASAQDSNVPVRGRGDGTITANAVRRDDVASNVLSTAEWQRVDAAVARALAFLGSQQQKDGSFPSISNGQPGVTALCVLAFIAQGHNPGEGEFGPRLERAIDFILTCQKKNGLIALSAPNGSRITRDVNHELGTTVVYNHAIASLALSEIYGMGHAKRAEQIQRAVDRSLRLALEMQRWPKNRPQDRGGWRYLDDDDTKDSDLSVTGWQLMFLRSARNAGFDVPEEPINDAIAYVRRSFDSRRGAFNYTIGRKDVPSRGMAGAGILALGHAGFHKSLEAQRTGEWLMQYSFEVYNDNLGLNGDRYHYSLFTCCQGMYQLGSPYWEQFFPRTVSSLLAHQQPDGSWEAESYQKDRPFGNSYTTALVVLALGAPNQFLPIFQR
jgi:hypothetical protein